MIVGRSRSKSAMKVRLRSPFTSAFFGKTYIVPKPSMRFRTPVTKSQHLKRPKRPANSNLQIVDVAPLSLAVSSKASKTAPISRLIVSLIAGTHSKKTSSKGDHPQQTTRFKRQDQLSIIHSMSHHIS